MQEIAVYATFTKIAAKEGIKRHGIIEISSIYKEYTQLEDMEVMGNWNLTASKVTQNRITANNKSDKVKEVWENKRENMRIWQATKVIHI